MIEQPNRKFEEVYDVSDYEVWTDTGWRDISKVCKTEPYEVFTIHLENGKYLGCADDHIVYVNGNEIFAKDVNVGDYVDTEDGPSKCLSKSISNSKENMYDLQVDGGKYYTNGVLSHNTTIVSVFILWFALFNNNKVIGVVSNKESSAKMILGRIKRMYEFLPSWIKPGAVRYAETSISFDNGTQIKVSATSPDAFRGETINFLLCDEFAFVPRNQASEFWASNYPTISASKESKVVLISTPNGMYNLFYRIYTEGEIGHNSFYTIKITWRDVPDRDEEWAKRQRKNLGKQKFAQEHDCDFLGSANTVIDSATLERLMNSWIEPSYIEMEGHFLIYEKPEPEAHYVMGCDVAKGTGKHYSTIQILKMESLKPIKLKQVAVYINNTIDVYSFSDVINKMSYYYNNAYILVENNAEGAAVVSRLWWDHENTNLVNTGSKAINLGVRATRTSKPKAVLLMKKLIEDGSLELIDKETIDELTAFVDEGGKYFGKEKEDDAVSGLYWAVHILNMNILGESFEFQKSDKQDEAWGILSDISVIEEDWSWLNTGNLRD